MSPIVLSALVFVGTFGGSMIGIWLRHALPDHHLDDSAKDTVKVGVGFLATITALLLSFVISSGNNSFKTTETDVRHLATQILTLDRALARYGSETAEIRNSLKALVQQRLELSWPRDNARQVVLITDESTHNAEKIPSMIRKLSPQTDEQVMLKAQATTLCENVLEDRWALFSSPGGSIPQYFLWIMVFWLGIIFTSFGLFAPKNPTIVITLFVCSVCISSAIFLVVELDTPLGGFIKVSPEPLQYALEKIDH